MKSLLEIDCTPLKGRQIAVLKGGSGPERPVSLVSGKAVADALRSRGHTVTEVDITNHSDITHHTLVLPTTTDLAFNMIHGTFGEDGTLQAILEERGIPFTGEGSQESHLAFDKVLTKERFTAAGIPTAHYEVLTPGKMPSLLAPPFVLKPIRQGSTIGVHIVQEPSQLKSAMEDCFKYGDEILVEKFCPGKELTVSIIGDIALPIVEIVPKGGFYSYNNKYTPGGSTYFTPARITPKQTEMVQKTALAAHKALGLQIYSRVDLFLNEKEEMNVLEANTLPGMTPTSLMPKAAAAIGIDFPSLCEIIGILSLRRNTT